jgi:hypothetical protein
MSSVANLLQVFRSKKVLADTYSSFSTLERNINNNNASLCQSMDLIMIQDSSTSNLAVKVFSTVDRREVAILQLGAASLLSDTKDECSASRDNSSNASSLCCMGCWSPNGQSVAVVTTSTSSMTATGTTKTATSKISLFNILAANGSAPMEPYHSFEVAGIVKDVHWTMAGKDHPTKWMCSSKEVEQEVAWR